MDLPGLWSVQGGAAGFNTGKERETTVSYIQFRCLTAALFLFLSGVEFCGRTLYKFAQSPGRAESNADVYSAQSKIK